MTEFINIVIYSGLGIILMTLGTMAVDWVIPCHFPTEIKKRNAAVGTLMAGVSIGIGIIIKAAIMSPTFTEASEGLALGVISTVYYYITGLVVCILGYLLLQVINRRYDLNKEIGDGNTAAGVMVAGMFVGISIIISGVIM